MSTPRLARFDTEIQLTDYADNLNESGMTPELAIMDSAGNSALATLQAPGGDGWGFAYYGVNNPDEGTIVAAEEGCTWVKPTRYLSEYRGDWDSRNDWKPEFPVFAIVADPT
jgi:hypothetical protein